MKHLSERCGQLKPFRIIQLVFVRAMLYSVTCWNWFLLNKITIIKEPLAAKMPAFNKRGNINNAGGENCNIEHLYIYIAIGRYRRHFRGGIFSACALKMPPQSHKRAHNVSSAVGPSALENGEGARTVK